MSKEIDLNENMSSEEIRSYAESVVQEVEAERKGESKSDAQIVSEVSSATKPSAEKNASSESAEEVDQGELSGDESSFPDWVDDDVKAEVAAYGIDESDLSDFASREELSRALRLIDKTALEAGRKATVEGESNKTRNEKGKFVKKGESDTDESEAEKPKDGRYQISLSKDIYDDEIVNEFERMRDHYESRLEALESHFMEVSAKEEERQFDNFIDSLGHSDLFGKTGSESAKELERRRDLHVAVKAQLLGLERLGRPTKLDDKLVARVADMVFSDELSKKRLKQQTQKISRQSQLRQGGSPTKPTPLREDPRDEADRLYRELERA
jgi:hypothetical protein